MEIKTKFYLLRNKRTGRFFFGQEKVDRKGKRHNDTVYTKLLGDWKRDDYTIDSFGITQEGHHLDKKIHKRLRVHPDCIPEPPGSGSNELFEFKKRYTRPKINLLCEQYIKEEFGENENLGTWRDLFNHQKQFKIKIKSFWENWKDSLNEFVLFAKCRAGKCTMVYSAIDGLKSNVKVTLIVARQKSPVTGWENDCCFKNFDNLVFINLKDPDAVEQIETWYKTEKQLVLWSTVQGHKRWKNIPYNVDLIVYDEADVGFDKPEWNELREVHNNAKVLYVTGTAYKLLYRLDNDQVFNYSYPQEQREKKLGSFKNRTVPTMIPRMIQIDTPALREYFGDDVATAFKNMWNTPNKNTHTFVYPNIVQEFVNQVGRYNPKFGPDDQPFQDSTHMIGHLPSIAACHASVKYWKGTRFEPLVVTGDTKENEKSINNFIKSHPNGSIILTNKANVRGSTYELIDTVLNMCEGKDLSFYLQFLFRGGSGSKEKWYFYDFSPERRLVSMLEEMRIACVAADPSLEDYKFTAMYPIEVLQNGWRQLSEDEIEEILIANSNQSQNACANFWSCANKDIIKKIGCDTEYSSPEMNGAYTSMVNENDTNGKTNIIKSLSENKKEKEDKTLKQIKEYSKRLPLAILYALRNNSFTVNVRDFLKTPSFIHTTGDTDGVIMKALTLGAMSLQKYSTHLNEISKKVKKLLETTDLITAIEHYQHSGKDQKSVPQDVIRKQLKGLDRKSTIIIDGDPCGKHSLIAIEEGFSPENITVWEDDDRHHYAVKQIDDRINITDDYDALIYNQMRFTRAIGNPPYGSAANSAVKHLNKLSQVTDQIHLVLPISMRTESILNRISLDIVCVEDEDIAEGTFPKGIKAVEQVWVKGKREKIKTFTTHPDFTFVKKEDNPDVMMFRCGASAGKLKFIGEYEENKKDHYYMNVKDDSVIDVFKALYPEFVAVGLQQNGMPGISKHKLIELYQNYIDTHE